MLGKSIVGPLDSHLDTMRLPVAVQLAVYKCDIVNDTAHLLAEEVARIRQIHPTLCFGSEKRTNAFSYRSNLLM